MKSIITFIITVALAVSALGQTRNVLVGTNNTVVQPTNFWSADASNARTGLSLGSAATNPSSAFQPSSLNLSNLANGNGVSLSNLQSTNLVGMIPSSNIPSVTFTGITGVLTIAQGGTSATNASDVRANIGATAVGSALFTASNAQTARTAIGVTTVGDSIFTLVNPSAITFLRVNADNTVSAIGGSDFRTAIGLGSSATNPSGAFQPASLILTNLASSNALYLSNIQASNIVGLLSLSNGGTGADNAVNARANLGLGTAATNPASAFQTSSGVLSNVASSNAINLTNLQATNIVGFIPATNFSTVSLTNIGGVLSITQGGTGATNAAEARTNIGLGWSALTNTNVATALLGFTTNGQVIANTGTNTLAFTNATKVGSIKFSSAGGVVSYEDINVLDFEEPSLIGSWVVYDELTFANPATTRTNLGLGAGNSVQFSNLTVFGTGSPTNLGIRLGSTNYGIWGSGGPPSVGIGINGTNRLEVNETKIIAGSPIEFAFTNHISITRTNLGLGWSALTNTNAGTGLVSVNTNGEVVSPTNFWQVAPIATTVTTSAPIVNATNTATNSRNLILTSLGIAITGVTNTIQLPTNSATLNGDTAVVIHSGGTNSATAIRQAGSTSNLIVITNFDHAVRFLYSGNTWDFYHNLAYVEPIYFSGTNTLVNAATSRTNLGLGGGITTNLVLKNSANNDTYMNFSNGILIYGSTTPP